MHLQAFVTTSFYVHLARLVSVSLPVIMSLIAIPQSTASALDTQNQHPLAHIYAIPQAAQLGESPQHATWFTEFQHSVSNTSYDETHQNETILLDGELNRSDLSVGYRWPIKPSQSNHHEATQHAIQMTIPWISHSGGQTDSLISGWHSVFGLPNGNRDQRNDDQLYYFYQKGAKALIDQRTSASGLGDIELQWSRTTYLNARGIASGWSAGLHLPTGEGQNLLGSDTTDVFLQWQINASPHALGYQHLGSFGGLGLVYSIGDGVLDEQLNAMRVFGHLGLSWQLGAVHQTEQQTIHLTTHQLITQITYQTAVYESGLSSLSGSTQLSVGLRSRFNASLRSELYFTEDIRVNTAPDFGLGLKLSYDWP